MRTSTTLPSSPEAAIGADAPIRTAITVVHHERFMEPSSNEESSRIHGGKRRGPVASPVELCRQSRTEQAPCPRNSNGNLRPTVGGRQRGGPRWYGDSTEGPRKTTIGRGSGTAGDLRPAHLHAWRVEGGIQDE